MRTFIDAAFNRSRTVLAILALLLISGFISYNTIPKEAEPDVAIPIIYVSMSHEGISPEDAERLLVRPMEKELQTIEGVKEMRSTAGEGHASVLLEFDAGFDSDKALQDVREKVDLAKVELPADTDEPSVNEVNVALFPVLVVTLAGVAGGVVVGAALVLAFAGGIDLSAWSAGVELAGLRSLLVPRLLATDLVIVVAFAVLLALLGSLYPAWRAVRIEPLDALRGAR